MSQQEIQETAELQKFESNLEHYFMLDKLELTHIILSDYIKEMELEQNAR